MQDAAGGLSLAPLEITPPQEAASPAAPVAPAAAPAPQVPAAPAPEPGLEHDGPAAAAPLARPAGAGIAAAALAAAGAPEVSAPPTAAATTAPGGAGLPPAAAAAATPAQAPRPARPEAAAARAAQAREAAQAMVGATRGATSIARPPGHRGRRLTVGLLAGVSLAVLGWLGWQYWQSLQPQSLAAPGLALNAPPAAPLPNPEAVPDAAPVTETTETAGAAHPPAALPATPEPAPAAALPEPAPAAAAAPARVPGTAPAAAPAPVAAPAPAAMPATAAAIAPAPAPAPAPAALAQPGAAPAQAPQPAAARAAPGAAGTRAPAPDAALQAAPAAAPQQERAPAAGAPGQGSGVEVSRSQAPEHLQDAWAALQRGEAARAGQLYQQVLAERPDDADAALGLAVALQRQGRSDAAWQAYQRSLELWPGNDTARVGSLALLAQSDPASAESRLREWIERQPRDAAAQGALGQLLGRQGRWPEALAPLTQAQQLAPGGAAQAYNLAVALDQLQRPQDAMQMYRQALQLGAAGIPVRAAQRRISELQELLWQR